MQKILAASALLLVSFCAYASAQPFPQGFSWARVDGNNYMTPSQPQSGCSSCTIFATVGVLEAMLQIRNGTPNTGLDLSEQYVVNCWAHGCQGGQISEVLAVLESDGTYADSCLPYLHGGVTPCTATTPPCPAPIMSRVAAHGEAGFYDGVSTAQIDWLKSALMNHGPIAITEDIIIPCDPEPCSCNGSTKYVCDDCEPPCETCTTPQGTPLTPEEQHPCVTGHAVIIYGWQDSLWLVKNSNGGGEGPVDGLGNYVPEWTDPSGWQTVPMTNHPKYHRFAYEAHWLEPDLPPDPVSTAVGFGHTSATVNWVATGADRSTGTAQYYEMRRSSGVIDSEATWMGAQVIHSGSPGSAGTPHCFTVTGLGPCQPYYFAVRLQDAAGNWSPLGTSGGGTTRCQPLREIVCDEEGLILRPPTEEADLPAALELGRAVPNPVTGEANLDLAVPARWAGAYIDLALYDISGRRVRTLLHGPASPGRQTIHWDGSSEQGLRVEPGCYFARLKLGGEVHVRTLLVTGR